MIVANNKSGAFSPFVIEQVESIKKLGVQFDFYGVSGKGILGYLKCFPALKRKIREFKPDVIHAHYGLSGLHANLQRKVPVVTTFHGSDIHSLGVNLMLSKICMHLSAYNIFTAENIFKISKYSKDNYTIQSCGLDLETIKPTDFYEAREYFGWNKNGKYILFSSRYDNAVKNSKLALAATQKLNDVTLVELKGYTRKEVSLLMSACDVQLTTSFKETGPLVVKEAMACNRPIVTTDVGDVRWVMGDTEGCFITSYDADDCAEKLKLAIEFSKTKVATVGRDRIIELGLDSKTVAYKMLSIYSSIITNIK